VRAITINTHRGLGPTLAYLLRNAPEQEQERARLLHRTRVYAYHIAEWLRQRRDDYDIVALQEVFRGLLGLRFRQRDYYRAFSGYPTAMAHAVGSAAFQYENVLLSSLPSAAQECIHSRLPCRIYRLAACGFTLAPYRLRDRTIWIGNTHLHPYRPRARAFQAASIARTLRRLGDVPILFLGDFNTVPPGCREGDFPDGERDRDSYRGDRTLRILSAAGLRWIAHADTAEFHTYPTGAPNRTLDFILFSRHWDVEEYRVAKEFALSDHYPVEAALRLRAT